MPRGDTESENQEGAISFETLRDEGQHFVHVQQFDKAIESFTKVYVKRRGWGDIPMCVISSILRCIQILTAHFMREVIKPAWK